MKRSKLELKIQQINEAIAALEQQLDEYYFVNEDEVLKQIAKLNGKLKKYRKELA